MTSMSFEQIKALFDAQVIGNYGRVPVAFVRGEGSQVWDSEGSRYVDLFPGWGTTVLGHCHPRVVTSVQRQASLLMHVDNSFYTVPQGQLARMVGRLSFGGKCFFCNSGAEAVEAAIKLARLHKQDAGRYKVVTLRNSFHGRTMGAISATAQDKYHKGYLPLLPGFAYAPFNDLGAVRAAVDDETCAVMLEVIQGEGGINVGTDEFVRGVRALCDEAGLLMIVDEVSTGIGRTGQWFGYQHYGVEPDIMTLAKAFGSGMPIGAMVAKGEVAESLAPGTHASTFGGSPLACSAALATLKVIEDGNLLAACNETGEHVRARFEQMAGDYGIVREVRGRGCMWGLELTRPGAAVFQRCLERRVRVNCTHETVMRVYPALNVPRELLDEGLDVLEEALADADAGKI